MLARSFLIESSSKLLVTRTGTKARSNLILGRIRPLILELLALEWRKISHFWIWISLKPVGQSWSNFMCSIIGVGERLHKILGHIDLDTLDSGERSLPFGLLVKLALASWHSLGTCTLLLVQRQWLFRAGNKLPNAVIQHVCVSF